MSAGRRFSMIRTKVYFSTPILFDGPRLLNIVKEGKTSADLCQSTRPDVTTFFNLPIITHTFFYVGFNVTRRFVTASTRALCWFLSWARWIQSKSQAHFSVSYHFLPIYELKSHRVADVPPEIRIRFLQNTVLLLHNPANLTYSCTV
jgi:hypothetical protein